MGYCDSNRRTVGSSHPQNAVWDPYKFLARPAFFLALAFSGGHAVAHRLRNLRTDAFFADLIVVFILSLGCGRHIDHSGGETAREIFIDLNAGCG